LLLQLDQGVREGCPVQYWIWNAALPKQFWQKKIGRNDNLIQYQYAQNAVTVTTSIKPTNPKLCFPATSSLLENAAAI
jgi:hypothetical protein